MIIAKIDSDCSVAHFTGYRFNVIEETNVSDEFILLVNRVNYISARIVPAPQRPMFSAFQNLLKSHQIRLMKKNVCLSFHT